MCRETADDIVDNNCVILSRDDDRQRAELARENGNKKLVEIFTFPPFFNLLSTLEPRRYHFSRIFFKCLKRRIMFNYGNCSFHGMYEFHKLDKGTFPVCRVLTTFLQRTRQLDRIKIKSSPPRNISTTTRASEHTAKTESLHSPTLSLVCV